jgi:hypothetical protein
MRGVRWTGEEESTEMYRDPVRFYDSVARPYKRCRPGYPAELFEDLASLAPGLGLAWDVGTGSNAASVLGLVRHFDRVVATDICPRQIAEAGQMTNVEFCQASADVCPLGDGSADLITAA